MNASYCASPIAPATLVEYWLGELDAEREAQLEEHLMACDACTAALSGLAEVAAGIRALVGQAVVHTVVTDAFVQRLAGAGIRMREYRVQRNGSVHCTVGPDDDMLVSRLEAPLDDVAQVDVVIGLEGHEERRLRDIPFDRAAGEVVMTPNIAHVRALSHSTTRMRLLAVAPGRESLLGEYTFIHSPWGAR